MKILLLNAGTSWGGIESQALVLARMLRDKGNTVIIGCSRKGYIKSKAESLGFPTSEIKISNSLDMIGFLKIIKVVLQQKIDIIIVTISKEYWLAVIASKLTKRKVITVRHLLYPVNKHTVWLMTRYADKILAVSTAVKNVLVQSGVPAEKINVTYNSIELDKFSSGKASKESIRKELGIPENVTVIGTAGKLQPNKGCFELVKAMAQVVVQHPDTFLLFVGDGQSYTLLQKSIKKFSLENKALITGLRNDMPRVYSAMDIFVLPSLKNEAFGIVLVEAMAMGKPVIGTQVGGIPEIIQHEINGLLVPPANPPALANAISRYIRNPDFSKKMALAGRKTVESKFSDKVLGDCYQKILEEIHPL